MKSCFSFLSSKRGTLEISQAQKDCTEAQLEQAALAFAQHGLPKARVPLKSTSSTRRSSITKMQSGVPPQYFDRPIDTNTPVMTNVMPGQPDESSRSSCSIQ